MRNLHYHLLDPYFKIYASVTYFLLSCYIGHMYLQTMFNMAMKCSILYEVSRVNAIISNEINVQIQIPRGILFHFKGIHSTPPITKKICRDFASL